MRQGADSLGRLAILGKNSLGSSQEPCLGSLDLLQLELLLVDLPFGRLSQISVLPLEAKLLKLLYGRHVFSIIGLDGRLELIKLSLLELLGVVELKRLDFTCHLLVLIYLLELASEVRRATQVFAVYIVESDERILHGALRVALRLLFYLKLIAVIGHLING